MSAPRVLVVSDTCISTAHGTGYLVLKQFSRYPPDRLANAFYDKAGEPAWPESFHFSADHSTPGPLSSVVSLAPRIYNRIIRGIGNAALVYHRRVRFTPDPQALAADIAPDAVYSVAYGQYGLALTDRICGRLPPSVPLIQYFLDYYVGRGLGRVRYLERVVARADELWALTESIAEALEPVARRHRKHVQVQPGFCMDLPERSKYAHRPAGPEFRCVITGNFWQDRLVHVVARAWGLAQDAIPGLAPIDWYCHPHSVARVEAAIGKLPREIRPVGRFMPEAELLEQLAEADLAILPFNASAEPEDDYSRYSIPSRLTELFATGLPVLCIAGNRTPVARYLAGNELGVVCGGEDEAELARRLIGLLHDIDARRRLGFAARRFAQTHFQLEPFQRLLYAKLGAASANSDSVTSAHGISPAAVIE